MEPIEPQSTGQDESLAMERAAAETGAIAVIPAAMVGTTSPAFGPPDPPEMVTYVYAIGTIDPRTPNESVRKEIERVSRRPNAGGLTDLELFQVIVQEAQNRYLVRQLCWVLTIEGQDTYILRPRDPLDVDRLADAVRARPRPDDMDVVIGILGPIAPPEVCNGLALPIVAFDQTYSFTREQLLQSIPRPDSIPEADDGRFRASAGEVLDRFLQVADNAGATDEHRALNYLAMRYPEIYAQITQGFLRNFGLDSVDVVPSRLSGVRKIVDVIVTLAHRERAVHERYVVQVDVTEEFPFLVAPLEPYFERV